MLLLLVVAVGQRETRLADLEAAVTEGRVDSVLVLGHAVPADGFSTQEVRWTDGLVRRTTRVTVASLRWTALRATALRPPTGGATSSGSHLPPATRSSGT